MQLSQLEWSEHQSHWHSGYRLWQRQDYLRAMEHFQRSLEPCQKAWNSFVQSETKPPTTTGEDLPTSRHFRTPPIANQEQGDADRLGFMLAKRLLFCAYCELDGQAFDAGQQRLTQCLSLLMTTRRGGVSGSSSWSPWDDAWMELMLSMEEQDDQRQFARNVAALGLSIVSFVDHNEQSQTKQADHSIVGPCGWTNAWQRPGYMASHLVGQSPMYIGRESQPEWCRELERHFPEIFEEYQLLRKKSFGWSKVGSGDRGSGHDDHRVVAGQDWSEFVLFGTGEPTDTTASKTRSLIRKHVPDAVSLAQHGGGEVIFSCLAPHTHIQAHCGPTNLRWTAHLGLVVPKVSEGCDDRCQIRVGVEWHNWETGRVLLFDDSFEHEVRNDTNEERVVLLLRVWHPQLPLDARYSCLAGARQSKEATIDKRYHPPPPTTSDEC